MDISTILEYIKENGSATIAEVCHKYGIGYKEARSFFADLEQKGLAKIEGSGFVYCGKKESDSEDDEDDEDEEEEGNETDIDEYIANLRRRLMKRIMGERSDADDTRDDEQKDEDESEDEEDSEEGAEDESEDIEDADDAEDAEDAEDADDAEDAATSLSRCIEATKRSLASYKTNAQETESQGEDDEKDWDEEPVSELEARADRERELLITELDGLFKEGEATGAASVGGELEESKQNVIRELMRIEGEAVAEGSTGGKARRVGFRHFIVAAIDDISVEEHEYYDDVRADLFYPDGTLYEISLMFDHYFTDNGKTLEYLVGKMDVTDEKVLAEIRRTAAQYSAELVDNELIARVDLDPQTALVNFMRFAVAIDAVAGINV